MPIQIDSVFYELALHDKDFAAALRKSAADLDALDGPAKKADTSIGGLANGMKSAGIAATSLRGEIVRLGKEFATAAAIREFIANTIDAQRAQAQLQAALRSTGGAAGFTLPELEKMSEEMSKLSIFSGEAVKGGLSRLLTYTGIQGPMFKEAARATLDFATALGIDVNSAAERVGNALQYPTEAINSLTKQGFRFTAEQKRLIAAFEDTGQLAKAQAIILSELDLAYKGSAEAARSTLGGALLALKNSFMETLEVSKDSSSGIIGALNNLADAMPHVRSAFDAFFTQLDLGFSEMSLMVSKSDLALAKMQVRVGGFLEKIPGLRTFGGDLKAAAQKVVNETDIAALEKLRDERVRQALGLEPTKPTPAGTPAATTPRGLTDAQLEAQKNARLAFAQATAAQTQAISDNFDTQVARLVASAQKAHIGAGEIQKMVNDLREAHAKAMAEEGQKLALTLQTQLAQLTTTTVDDLRAQLAEFDRTIEEQRSKGVPIDPTVVNQLRAAKEQAIALAPATEAIARDLERINATAQQGANLGGPLRELGDLIERQTAIRDQLRAAEGVAVGDELKGSVALKGAQEQLNALIAREAELRKQIRAIILANGDAATRLAGHVGDLSGGIADAANAAFGLASAFLGVDNNITKALGSIGQLAGGIGSVSDLAVKAGGFGKLFSSGAGIVSALPGIGQAIGGAMALASSLFGKSPEEQARLQALKENNARLRELSTKVGDLAKINVQGTQLGQFQSFFANPTIQNLLNNPGARFQSQDAINRQVGAVLNGMGLTSQELKDFAQQFGIKVGTGTGGKITIDDLQQLFKALSSSELGQFADDFIGQMSKLDTQIKLFDLSKPIQQFEAFRKALQGVNGGAGALTNILSTFDLTTAQGIEAAKKAIQDLFNQLGSLPADQLPALLGGLTADEFRQALERLRDIVNAQAGSGGIAGTGGFNVSRTITETTGNRLEALFSTGNIFAERTAKATELMAQLLGGSPTLIQAPNIATPGAAAQGGQTFVIESFTVNVGAGADSATAIAAGQTVGDEFVDNLDKKFGAKIRWNRRAQGITS
jgi:predicted glycoside hydrolase/deacetylase ChbG (UPF0249 family)